MGGIGSTINYIHNNNKKESSEKIETKILPTTIESPVSNSEVLSLSIKENKTSRCKGEYISESNTIKDSSNDTVDKLTQFETPIIVQTNKLSIVQNAGILPYTQANQEQDITQYINNLGKKNIL